MFADEVGVNSSFWWSRLILYLDYLDFERFNFLDADGIRRISDEGAEDEKIRFPEYFGKF